MDQREIEKRMKEIALRRPGNSRLVYDRKLQEIVVRNRDGKVVRRTGLSINE